MQRRGRVLVVDDDAEVRTVVVELLRHRGFEVASAQDAFKALGKLDEPPPDVILTDLVMPGMDGLELLRRVRARDPSCIGIVMTAHGQISSAVQAMREGALDYVVKPVDVDELDVVMARALERKRLSAESELMRARLAARARIPSLVGDSPAMQTVFETLLQVATSRATVLITGESGTGKELVAAALHAHSARVRGPFVKLNCAALAEGLLESELFGHERGAFTGALARRDGRFQQADGGTLFLDEIGEIPPATQVKLLRFLQEHELERVGGNETIKVDVRIVAATNRDLLARVREGRFREDLYYRLDVVNVRMPALRERGGDVVLLAEHFLRRFAAENQRAIGGFTDAALERLRRYRWPGNVRELENAIERAVIICRGDRIDVRDIAASCPTPTGTEPIDEPTVPGSSLAELERFAILKTLEHTGGGTARAAAILGISARKIQYKLQEWQSEQQAAVPPAAAQATRRS